MAAWVPPTSRRARINLRCQEAAAANYMLIRPNGNTYQLHEGVDVYIQGKGQADVILDSSQIFEYKVDAGGTGSSYIIGYYENL